jgi:peptide/nickel transport system permease protein
MTTGIQHASRPLGRLRLVQTAARSDVLVAAGVIVLVLIVLAVVCAPLIAPYDPNAIDFNAVLQGSSPAHILGTDENGRDIFSRLLFGGRPILAGTALIVVFAVIVGTALSLTAAWIGGAFDTAVSRALDIGFAFPGLLLAILAVAVFGPGLTAPVIALAIAYIPYVARIVRAAAVRERSLPYVSALWIHGESAFRINAVEILPNLLPVIVVQATISFGYALIDLAALSYLGLGVQPPTSDWGTMVADGQLALLGGHPEQSLYAGSMMVITVMACIVVGERLSARWSFA